MTTANQEFLIIKQKVEVLAGERGDPRQAAIRMIYLSQLQNLIGKLTKSTNDLQVLVSNINEDVLDVRADVTLMQGDVATVQQALSDANDNLDSLESDIIQLKQDVTGLSDATADVHQLQLDVGNLQTAQANTQSEVTQIKTDVTAVAIPAMSQGAVAAPPTAAQFNNLVSDVAALRTALLSMKTAIL